MSTTNRTTTAQQRLEEAEDMIDIGFSDQIDDIREEQLDPSSPAAVEVSEPYLGYEPDVTLLLDPDFDYLNRHQQRIALEHEGFHGMRAKGNFQQVLDDIDDPGLDRAVQKIDSQNSRALEEGLVQTMANTVDPYGHEGKVFRPEETKAVEDIIEEEGADLDEIAEWTDSAIQEIVDSYREIDEVYEVGDIHVETGTYAGMDYTAVAGEAYEVVDALADYTVEQYSMPYGSGQYDSIEDEEEDWEPSLFIPESEH